MSKIGEKCQSVFKKKTTNIFTFQIYSVYCHIGGKKPETEAEIGEFVLLFLEILLYLS